MGSSNFAPMEMRALGKSDLHVAPLAFGCNVFGWTVKDKATAFRLLDTFVGKGFNLVDTADAYPRWAPGCQGGESEAMMGGWLALPGNREKVVLATKVGSDMGQGKTLRKAYILKAVEGSLKRLRTDHIDLLQSHWDDLDTPQEETLAAYEQLVASGKVRWIGASNFSAERLRSALRISAEKEWPAYVTFQTRYNLFSRDEFEEQYLHLCLEQGLSVLTYYSLASGFLTGKYRHESQFGQSARGASMPKYLTPRGLKILEGMDRVAERTGAPHAAIALAWLMARPMVAAPIASATGVEQLHQLMQAAELRLSDTDVRELNEASAYADEALRGR